MTSFSTQIIRITRLVAKSC